VFEVFAKKSEREGGIREYISYEYLPVLMYNIQIMWQ
jgi:hypothetical protein